MSTPRMRMFAGPNGSGKSTLESHLPDVLLGVYLNPDEIEQEIRRQGFLDFAAHGVNAAGTEVLSFFTASRFLRAEGFESEAAQQQMAECRVPWWCRGLAGVRRSARATRVSLAGV